MTSDNKKITNINPAGIPEEMKRADQWILWRGVWNNEGKLTKVPYSPAGVKTGWAGAVWTYDEVLDAFIRGGFQGIGFSFKETGNFIGIDYDDIFDESGNIADPIIKAEIDAVNSYTEVTPSGNGLHIITKGQPREGWKEGTNKPAGEIYFSGRFFTVTGSRYDGFPETVNTVTEEALDRVYYRLNPPEEKNDNAPVFKPVSQSAELTDSEIVTYLLNHSGSADLYNGHVGFKYKSRSEADQALCCYIAFYTRDPARIYNIFCRSSLYRKDKWTDRKDYPVNTINNALQVVGEQYNPEFNLKASPGMKEIGSRILEAHDAKKRKTPAKAQEPVKYGLSVPDHLLTIPGVLGKIVEYYENTAPKSQPQFAVQTALAIGSVAMGRRWKTKGWNNYSSLYFINIGLSSSGKEHVRTVITSILYAADRGDMLGPPKYSSGSAVYSEVRDMPCHIGIIDEFGLLLESAKRSGNSHSSDALSVMMQFWGLHNSIVKIPAFSTLTLTQQQKEGRGVKEIHNPALSIMAMTTPNTFYSAITNDNVTSGFIPRFLIVESEIGRKVSRCSTCEEIDSEIIDWVVQCSTACASSGNLSEDNGPLLPPDPVVIPFDKDAEDLYKQYEVELIKRMDALDAFDIAEVLGRTRETAMKIGLIVAVSCGALSIGVEHAQWSIDYVDYYADQTVTKVKSKVSNSDFEAICKQVIDIIRRGGSKGETMKGISRKCKLYGKSDDRTRKSVINVLGADYDLVRVSGSYKKLGGASAERLVLSEHFNEDEWVFDTPSK